MGEYFTIEGVASTDAEDTYGEIVDQDGIDLSLVSEKLVTINIEHGDGFPFTELSIVGIVTDAEIRDAGLWIKGRIYRQHQYSDAIYKELVIPMGSLQLSIELADCVYGKGKSSNIIRRGTLTAVALTKNAANADTYAELLKSSRDPTIKQLIADIRTLTGIVRATGQRQQKKKRVIVKVMRVK